MIVTLFRVKYGRVQLHSGLHFYFNFSQLAHCVCAGCPLFPSFSALQLRHCPQMNYTVYSSPPCVYFWPHLHDNNNVLAMTFLFYKARPHLPLCSILFSVICSLFRGWHKTVAIIIIISRVIIQPKFIFSMWLFMWQFRFVFCPLILLIQVVATERELSGQKECEKGHPRTSLSTQVMQYNLRNQVSRIVCDPEK